MKSFSDNTVSKEKLDEIRNEFNEQHNSFVQHQLTPAMSKARNWMFGLAAFNLIVSTIVLLVALHKN